MKVKVDEINFFQFLGNVKNVIKGLEKTEEVEEINNFIEREYKLRESMLKRDQYYSLYIKCKDTNEIMARKLYQEYIIVKKEYDSLKGAN